MIKYTLMWRVKDTATWYTWQVEYSSKDEINGIYKNVSLANPTQDYKKSLELLLDTAEQKITWSNKQPIGAEGFWLYRAKKQGSKGHQESASVALLASGQGKTMAYVINGPAVEITEDLAWLWKGPINTSEI